jgi:ribosomal protein L32
MSEQLALVSTEAVKRCRKCAMEKECGEFRQGHRVCRKCQTECRSPERRAAQREYSREYRLLPGYHELRRKYIAQPRVREASRESGLWVGMCARSRAKGWHFDCSDVARERFIALFRATSNCGYCGVEWASTGNGCQPNSPSVDRIVPSKGYEFSNILLACRRCNAMKQDATGTELMALAIAVLKVERKTQLSTTAEFA